MKRFAISALAFLSAAANAAETPARGDLLPPPSQAQPSPEIVKCLVKIDVGFYDYDGKHGKGSLIVNRDLASDLARIFSMIEQTHFPVKGVNPVSSFGWSDENSMLADNTSAYNYRPITGGGSLSFHATGRAIDINPFCNPYVANGHVPDPAGSMHDPSQACALDSPGGAAVRKVFAQLGWTWGGSWTNPKDFQHFEKAGPNGKRAPYCR
jgi:peptidoglycan L-alanyl-D-glutamate endopeptidase CwlK